MASTSNHIPSKLGLKSNTRMSLNDRFKMLRQKAALVNPSQVQVQQQKARRLQLAQGSARNQRLALQMANRPSVQAALKLKRKSIQQRLGAGPQPGPSSQLKKRLGRIPTIRNQGLRPGAAAARLGAGPLKKRLNRGNFDGIKRVAASPRIRNRIGVRVQAVQELAARRGQFVVKKRFVGNKNKANGQLNQNQKSMNNQRPQNRFGNRKMNTALVKGKNKNKNQLQGQSQPQRRQQQQGKFKGKMGSKQIRGNNNQQKKKNGGGPSKGGKWQGKRQPKANREQLDQDLDAYMAKTRTHLDADLDSYMADATA